MVLQKSFLQLFIVSIFMLIFSINTQAIEDQRKVISNKLNKFNSIPPLTPCSTSLIAQFTMTTHAFFTYTVPVIDGDMYYFTVSGTLNFFAGPCSRMDAYYWFLNLPTPVYDPTFELNYPNYPVPINYNPGHFYTSCSIQAGANPFIFTFVDSYYLDNCGSLFFSVFHIANYPFVNLGNDTSICQGSNLVLDAGNPGCSYIWNTNETTQTITVTSSGQYSVTVMNGNSSFCVSSDTILVTSYPGPTILGPSTLCVTSAGNVYFTEAGMTNYLWSVSSGGSIIAGGGTDSIIVNWNTAGLQTVSVNYTDTVACNASVPTVYNVMVNPLPAPVISGPLSVCIGFTGNNYSTEAFMTGYIWTVSSGGIINSGAGSNSISVTWTTIGAQTVMVSYTNSNGCTAANPTIYNVFVNPLPVPTISGPSSVCVTTAENVYSTEVGMTNYLWDVPSGGTITTGVGTNTITVTWNTTGVGTVKVNYTNSIGCTAAIPSIYNITVNPLPVPTISGPSSPCVTSTGNVYSTEAGMINYLWNIPTGGTITAGTGTHAITITWNTSGVKTVTVNYTNSDSCMAANPTIYDVTVNPLPVPTISGPSSVCVTSSGNVYSTEAGMTNYLWSVSLGGNIISGAGTNAIDVAWNTTGIKAITLNYTDSNGCTAASPTVYIITVVSPPVVTFKTCFDTMVTTESQPIKLKGGIPLSGQYTGIGVINGSFWPAITDTGSFIITYTYLSSFNCSNSAVTTIHVTAPIIFSCGDSLKDIRDTKSYPTVLIGSQCWMSANLDFGVNILSTSLQRDNCVPEKYCFNNIPGNCNSYGGLYQWDELMQYQSSEGSQGLCLSGWHIPSESDWNTLFANYINNAFAASPLKYSGYSGFNALLLGMRHINKTWDFLGFATFFWSSTEHGSIKAWAHGMNFLDPSVSVYPASKANAFSLRCIKD